MQNIVNDYLSMPQGIALLRTIEQKYSQGNVYPKRSELFRAFNLCEKPSVVIIGQDPYHDGSADGLAFSSRLKIPPSLRNIFKEISANYPNAKPPKSADLSYLARQGVALLNASLSVEHGKPNSHQKLWRDFFTYTIARLDSDYDALVFMLWGKFAQGIRAQINTKRHLVLCAAHPSPLARGAFFGNEHFKKCNEFLRSRGKVEISWTEF